jgi:hypothetical protein
VEDQHDVIVRLRVSKNVLNLRGYPAPAPNGVCVQLQFIAAGIRVKAAHAHKKARTL